MTFSDNQLAEMKARETLELRPYYDFQGYSIGYGHFTGKADEGDYSAFDANMEKYGISPAANGSISVTDADNLFLQDTSYVDSYLAQHLTAPVSQTQYDGLADYAFSQWTDINTILSKVNAGDLQGAASIINQHIYAGGQVNENLVALRAEQANKLLNADHVQTAGFNWLQGLLIIGLAYGFLKRRQQYAR